MILVTLETMSLVPLLFFLTMYLAFYNVDFSRGLQSCIFLDPKLESKKPKFKRRKAENVFGRCTTLGMYTNAHHSRKVEDSKEQKNYGVDLFSLTEMIRQDLL